MSLISPSFFGMHVTATVDSTDYPQVPFFGLRMVDDQVTWKDIQPNNTNAFNFTTLDNWMTLAAAKGNEVLYTFYRVPVWAGGGSSFINPPTDVDTGNTAFKNFVTTLVTRYKGRIAYYEIWNEPDLQWTGTPAQLVKMGTDVYNIVHSIDPAAKVVGPSPTTSNQFGVHFLPSYYAAGGAPFQDIVGCHAYLYNNTVFSTVPEPILQSLSSLKTLMAANGIGNLPIWYTEGSYGGAAGGVDNNATMTFDQRVGYIAREYCLMIANGVARYYWYSWNNLQWGTMWSQAGGTNAVGVAYAILHGWLSNSTFNSLTQQADGSQVMSITRADSTPALIVWHTTSGQVNTDFVNMTDLTGMVTPIEGGFVSTGPKPILVSGSIVSHTYVTTTAVSTGDTVYIVGTYDGVRVSVQISQASLIAANAVGTAAVQNLIAAAFATASVSPQNTASALVPIGTFTQ